MLPKEPEDAVLRARDRRRRTPARALRRRRLKARSNRIEAARRPRVLWTGSSPHEHPVIDALRDRPAGSYAVRWGPDWDAVPTVEPVASGGLPLHEGDWTALRWLEYRLRGGRNALDDGDALRQAILAAEAPWRARCRLPLLDMRELWARLVGWMSARGVTEVSGLWAWLEACTAHYGIGQNGRLALQRAAEGALAVVEKTATHDAAQRAVDVMGLVPKLAQVRMTRGSWRAQVLATLDGLSLELAVEQIERDLWRAPQDRRHRAAFIQATRGHTVGQGQQRHAARLPVAVLPMALAWRDRLPESMVQGALCALVEGLEASPGVPTDQLQRVLDATATWAGGKDRDLRHAHPVWQLALLQPQHQRAALALLHRVTTKVPTSSMRLVERTWQGELAIAENLLFRSEPVDWNAIYAWDKLRPCLRPFFRACFRRTERVSAALSVLELMHTVHTLPSKSVLDAAVSAWGPGEGPADARVARLRTLLGVPESREFQRLRSWRAGLQRQLPHVHGDRAAAVRAKLDSPTYADHMADRLDRLHRKTEEQLGLQWLRRCAQDALAAHFHAPTLGNQALHAVRMALAVTSNRRIAHKLVRAELAGDRGWRLRHPTNRAWMADARARGLDIDAWLAPRSRVLHDLTARTSEGPLEDLLMGERFDTCLALDGCNNHSAVANAAELNKRVLWVERNGRIVGRKLVALDGAGLVGFSLYGEWDPRVLVAVDALAVQLAQAVGAHLQDSFDGDLSLFADWYDDGEKAWDWWLPLDADERILEGQSERRWTGRDQAASVRLALLEPRVWDWAQENNKLPEGTEAWRWPDYSKR